MPRSLLAVRRPPGRPRARESSPAGTTSRGQDGRNRLDDPNERANPRRRKARRRGPRPVPDARASAIPANIPAMGRHGKRVQEQAHPYHRARSDRELDRVALPAPGAVFHPQPSLRFAPDKRARTARRARRAGLARRGLHQRHLGPDLDDDSALMSIRFAAVQSGMRQELAHETGRRVVLNLAGVPRCSILPSLI